MSVNAGPSRSSGLLAGFAVVAVVVVLAIGWAGLHLLSALRGPSLASVAVRTDLTPVAGGTLVRMTLTPSGSSSLPAPLTVRLTSRDAGSNDDGGPQPTGQALTVLDLQGSGQPVAHPEPHAVRVDGLRPDGGEVRLSFRVPAVTGRRVVYPGPDVAGAAVRSLTVLGGRATCTVAAGGGEPPGAPHYNRGRLAADGRLTGTDGHTYPARCELP